MTPMHALVPLLDGNGWHHGHWWIVFPILWLLLLGLVIALLAAGPRPR
jgi:hypothetical protein